MIIQNTIIRPNGKVEIIDVDVADNYFDPPATPAPSTDSRVAKLEADNTMLAAQLKAVIQSNQMLEDCLVEMAGVVYG